MVRKRNTKGLAATYLWFYLNTKDFTKFERIDVVATLINYYFQITQILFEFMTYVIFFCRLSIIIIRLVLTLTCFTLTKQYVNRT